jgi:hypothetical protein
VLDTCAAGRGGGARGSALVESAFPVSSGFIPGADSGEKGDVSIEMSSIVARHYNKRWVKNGDQAPVASAAISRKGRSCHLPVVVGGSALDCTGDLESIFFDASLGELPMIAFESRVRG